MTTNIKALLQLVVRGHLSQNGTGQYLKESMGQIDMALISVD